MILQFENFTDLQGAVEQLTDDLISLKSNIMELFIEIDDKQKFKRSTKKWLKQVILNKEEIV
jgi:hypothetical protein